MLHRLVVRSVAGTICAVLAIGATGLSTGARAQGIAVHGPRLAEDYNISDLRCATHAERLQLRRLSDEHATLWGQIAGVDAQLEQMGASDQKYREYDEASKLVKTVDEQGYYSSSDQRLQYESAKATVKRLASLQKLREARRRLQFQLEDVLNTFLSLLYAIQHRKCEPKESQIEQPALPWPQQQPAPKPEPQGAPELPRPRFGPYPSLAGLPPSAGAGYFVQVGVGGSWSVPALPEGESGRGSGATFNAAFGKRWGFVDHWSAGLIRFETYSTDESFTGIFDDLKVRPNVIISAIGQIGPNFPGFGPGQVIAPYVETGPSVGYLKVSDAAGSNTKWTGGWTIGGGFDYRINSWLLFDVNAHWTYLSTKTYQTGPFDVRLNEQVASVTGGFIFQFGQ